MYHYCRETESWARHDASAQVSGLCADTVRAITGLVRATMHVCRCRWAGIWHPRPATAGGCASEGSGGWRVPSGSLACLIVAMGQVSDRYKWVALSNTTLSMTMATIDASIVIVAMPAIFRGIHLNPLTPGNVTYLLWMIIGYLLVQSVVVVTLGRLGDIFGRVRIYNLGFVVFTAASIALSLDPLTGGGGALWLIGWRVAQAFGGAMLMSNSAAILTDAFPANRRGMALGVNQIAGISGQFVGLLLGGLLAAWDWRAVFWINVPIGAFGTVWAYPSLHELATTRRARIDWAGNATFAPGAGTPLAADTHGNQPYGGPAPRWAPPPGRARPARGPAPPFGFPGIPTQRAR